MTRFEVEIKINNKDYTRHLSLPIKWSNLLDERLDEAYVDLKCVCESNFEPLSDVYLTISNTSNLTDAKTIHMLVANDTSDEFLIGSGYYNHTLYLIEETKYLEGFYIGSCTFTNSMLRKISFNAYDAAVVVYERNYIEWFQKEKTTINKYKVPKEAGTTLKLVNATDFFADFDKYNKIWYTKDRQEIESVKLNGVDIGIRPDLTYTLVSGNYEITYFLLLKAKVATDYDISLRYIVTIPVASNMADDEWTIANVIDRLITLSEIRLQHQPARFKLNDEQALKFKEIKAPEFTMTDITLRQGLQEVGKFIHAEPRLVGNVIYFDYYGNNEYSSIANKPYVLNSCTQGIEQYATQLDSSVQNLVNQLDYKSGAITEPYSNAYKTCRAENVNIRIEEGNMIISTQLPIYSVTKLECGYLQDGRLVGDITDYCMEKSQYDLLSSYDDNYPNSKALAIYFTQGERNIKGLTFKQSHPVSQAFKKYSIVNIISNAINDNNYNPTMDGKDGLSQLAFRITYIPVYNTRISQSKQCLFNFSKKRALVYNQSASLVEPKYFGENIKGLIARIGNIEKSYTYKLINLTDIPKAGQLFNDNYYISSVNCEVGTYFILCTIGLSKDFNQLSSYIGISSENRYYEVATTSQDRSIIYTDYAVITDDASKTTDNLTLVDQARARIRELFYQNSDAVPISCVELYGESDDNTFISTPLILPVVSCAFGNSLNFHFAFKDNYSAGNKIIYKQSGDTDGYFTEAVQYSNYFGKLKYLYMNLMETDQTMTFYARQQQLGNSLPAITEDMLNISGFFTTKSNNLLMVDKDNREVISVSYNLEFITDDSKYLIGSAMAQNCSLVCGNKNGYNAQLYILPRRLNRFEDVVDLTNATLIYEFEDGDNKIWCDMYSKDIKFAEILATKSGKAWAMVDKKEHRLILGKNVDVNIGDRIVPSKIVFMHDIIDKI